MTAGTAWPVCSLVTAMTWVFWCLGSAATAWRSSAGMLGRPMSPDRIVGTLAGELLSPLRTRMMSRDWSAPGDASWEAMSVASWVMLVVSVLSVASNWVCATGSPAARPAWPG